MKKEKLLILGCGDIGCRMAGSINTQSCEIFGLCRSGKNLPAPIRPLRADACNPAQMRALLANGFDVVVITLTPDTRDDAEYHHTFVESMKLLVGELQRLDKKPRLIVFVSSTSVYGQTGGEIVDEHSKAKPSSWAGLRLLEAERLLLESSLSGCVVRFSGIYGRESGVRGDSGGDARPHLIQQVMQGLGCAPAPPQYTNRIHADDCAGVLVHLIERHKRGIALQPVYLGTDCEPVPLWDIQHWLAQRLGVPAGHLRPADRGRRAGSKRCSNRLLLETGYRFRYPSYREGYGALLEKLAVVDNGSETRER